MKQLLSKELAVLSLGKNHAPGLFSIGLKAGNAYSAYFFNSNIPITSGTFNTLGVSVNKNGNPQALSHASLFVVKNPTKEVPEPFTAAALAMVAIGGLGALKKKQA